MPKLELRKEIDAPIDKAWPVFSNFGGFREWAMGGAGSIEVQGDGVGMVRLLDVEGMGTIGEQLKLLDNDARTIGYELVEGQPIGMAKYKATIAFEDLGGGRCRLNWEGEFEPAEGMNAEEVGQNLKGSWEGMSASLEAFVQAQN